MTIDDEMLVQRLKAKYHEHDTSNFDVLDFVSACGSPLDALMYARLFWPDFVEISGLVFWRGLYDTDEEIAKLTFALANDRRERSEIEKSHNSFEIPSGMFAGAFSETTDEEDKSLANLLCQMWTARLKMLFPERSFEVKVLAPDETGGEIGIVFWQPK